MQVDFKTENGTALAGVDYSHREGTLTFEPKEDKQIITIDIIDDDEFETDEHFTVVLSNGRATSSDGTSVPCKVVTPTYTTVIVIDNDHCGAFGFESETFEVSEPKGEINLKVSCVLNFNCKQFSYPVLFFRWFGLTVAKEMSQFRIRPSLEQQRKANILWPNMVNWNSRMDN